MDNNQDVVVAHCWEARIDDEGKLISGLDYSAAADAPQAPERFRSMLWDFTAGLSRNEE